MTTPGSSATTVATHLDLAPADLHLVDATLAPRLIAPAADAITPQERARIVADEPLSLLRVLGPEGREGADAGRVAGDRIRELVGQGGFHHLGPVLAFHELSRDGHRQLGLVAEVPVAHHEEGLVRGHESTRRDLEEAMSGFLLAAGMDVSPVALTYRARPELDRLAAELTDRAPDLDVVAWGRLRHRVWVISDPPAIERARAAFAALDQLTIVDGHHRVAAAAHRAARHAADDTFLATLLPDRDLAFASYDRCIDTDASPDRLGDQLAAVGPLRALSGTPERPTDPHEVLVHLAGRWHVLTFEGPPTELPDGLAVVLLQERVLGPVLGVSDPREDPRLVHVPGTVALEELAARTADEGQVAFVLPPVTLDELQRVAAAGKELPPKSTYSDPKAGPGVFLRLRERSLPGA